MTTEVTGNGPAPELPGSTMIGGYRLLQQLGEGGMGVVHLALDRTGRAVAIKVLRPHVAHDPGARERLAREVDTLSRIRHPNVAPILDHDVEGELPYIVTRYIAGPQLDDVVEADGALRGEALLRLGRGLAGALHAIHEAGVVHRDVKPGNVLVLDGEPMLIDFGIAHIADDVRLTRTGLVMGTPGYLSPEIVEGAEVTDSTDWWGWAATLGFAASGRAPFGRGTMETVLARVVRGDADLSGVDPDLVPLLEAAMSPDPADRPTDAEVLAALETYAAGGQVTDVIRVVPRADATSVLTPPPTSVLAPVVRERPPVAEPPRSRWGRRSGQPAAYAAPSPSVHAPPVPVSPGPGATGSGVRVADVSGPGHSGYAAPAYAPAPASAPVGHGPSGYAAPPPPGRQVDGSAAYGPGGGPPRPAMAGDPRIGRVSRSGVLVALAAALVAGAAISPGAAVVAGVLWSIVARSADRTVTSLVLRRHNKGVRGSDVPMAVLASPLHLVTGVVATAAAVLVPAAVGLAGAFATLLGFSVWRGFSTSVEHQVALVAGMALAVMMAWWGPGGAGLRRGSRSIARGLAPNATAAQGLGALLALLAVALLGYACLANGLPEWWPLAGAPQFFDTLTLPTR